ncbi:CRP/FNR family transcriptional regulator [Natronocella acetinitrilica]|uniref:CRP/FNR family transcriptional regulator n=1 Tax=Natronocella acetinitrilica TaxID=414046 RepID=A0AAE3KCH6_9GAMM|nr:fumarate/nitrate reduction transcriptional regulator Fnr [Natronocella acetinitrilica]MCP1674958.1 CRP/FNR family transcriptional regulator [Natronocella acetinitrilica]
MGIMKPVADNGVRLRAIREACSSCSLSDLCLPVALEGSDVDALDRIVQRRRPLNRGDQLYRAGNTFGSIYAVRTGSLKSSTLSEDGEEQITAFHLPGELLGLDAISFDHHPSTAEALETTSLCEIPFTELELLSAKIPGLQHQLLRIMSREIFDEQEMLLALARRTAEQRLAILLLSLGDRFGRRGLSPTRYRLPMSRHDLSNYLGLAPETMSRLFKRFVDQGWICASGREVHLTDVPALREMTGNPNVRRQSEGA